MDNDRDQGFDEQRDSSIDKANSAIKTVVKNRKRIQQVGKKANNKIFGAGGGEAGTGEAAAGAAEGAAAEGAGAAAGAAEGAVVAEGGALVAEGGAAAGAGALGVGGGTVALIVLLVLLIVVLIFAIFMIIFGGVQNVNAGTPVTCQTLGGTCRTSCLTSEVPDPQGATCSATLTNQVQVCCQGVNQTTPANSDVLAWAKAINSHLTYLSGCTNGWYGYNRQQATVVNSSNGYKARIMPGTCNGLDWGTYFCSYLVEDSYRLAGYSSMTLNGYAAMIAKTWTSNGTGFTLKKTNNLQGIKPGYAIFWSTIQNPPSISPTYFKHTDIVYTLSLDSNGNGSMQTLDANVGKLKVVKYNVVSWRIQPVWTDGANSPWFGIGPF